MLLLILFVSTAVTSTVTRRVSIKLSQIDEKYMFSSFKVFFPVVMC